MENYGIKQLAAKIFMKPIYSTLPRVAALAAFFIVVLTFASAGYSQNNGKLDKAKTRITNSTAGLKAIAALSGDQSIPAELIAKARVIAVFPNVEKINMLFAKAMKGSGLAARRTADGWATPVFYQFGMVDKGWTTMESKSPTVVMLFMDDAAFKKDYIDISNTVAGPIGSTLNDADKKRLEGVRVVAYGLTGEKLIGVKIEDSDSIQSNMGIDNAMNKPVFGKKGNEVFWAETSPADMMAELKDLQSALAGLTRSK